MSTLTKKDINLFLGVLVVSLIGNVCADNALMWYGLSLIAPSESTGSSSSLTYFYVGQAVGVIALSPLFAVVFDRFSKLLSSIALDVLYAVMLVAMAVLFKFDLLSPAVIFVFSMLTAALAILHKSSVGFAAVQRMSEITGVTDVVAKFIAALNVPFLIGSVLSGIVFQYLGFMGCMVIGVVSFLPMPFIYFRIFGKEKIEKSTSSNFIRDLKDGVTTLKGDKLLSGTALSVAVVNIASAVMPAIVGFAFMKAFPGRTDYASIAISVSILAGIIVTKKVGELAKTWPTQAVIPLSVLPAGIALILCLVFPNPFLVAFMFLLSCVGSAARNVSTGSLRVARVPKALIGRVNTVYSSLLYVGQTIGGFVVIKAVQNDFEMAIWSILACFVAASFVSYMLLPQERVSAVLEASK